MSPFFILNIGELTITLSLKHTCTLKLPAIIAVIILVCLFNFKTYSQEKPHIEKDPSWTSFHYNLIEKDSIKGFLDKQPIKPLKDAAITFVNDGFALLTSPLRIDSSSFLTISSIVLTTWFLLIVDEPVTFELLANKKYANSGLMKAAEVYGRNTTSEITAAGFTLAGIAFSDKKLVRIGLEIFEAYYFANNIHSLVKRTLGRARPYEEKGPYYFDPFPDRKNPQNALPSGHAVMSFSLSTVLASHVDNIYLKILAYIPAVLTCFSRVYQNQHWLSDVFVGGVLGHVVADYVVSRHNNEKNNYFSLGIDNQGRFSLFISL